MLPVATLEVRAVRVRCPHCRGPLYEVATPVDSTPWGEIVLCWTCRKTAAMPTYPFTLRPR